MTIEGPVKCKNFLLCSLLLAIPGYASQSVLGNDGVQSLLLTPNGAYFALLKRKASHDELFIVNVAQTRVVARKTRNAPERIQSIMWLDNQRLALQLGKDVQYERRPQRTETFGILTVTGESSEYDNSGTGYTELQQTFTGQSLFDSEMHGDSIGANADSMDDSRDRDRVSLALGKTLPGSEVSIVNSSSDGSRLVAKVTQANEPNSFYLVDTLSGRSRRLLGSENGLTLVGGEDDVTYTYRSFRLSSKLGEEVSGYVSLPEKRSSMSRPTVVMVRDVSDTAAWPWEFDEEIWFFNRQGFNVLMINTGSVTEASDIAEAISWLIEENLSDAERICLYGRGTGAETALLLVLRDDTYHCAISMGGTFSSVNLPRGEAPVDRVEDTEIQILFIYGEDEEPDAAAIREDLQRSLGMSNIETVLMSVANEKSLFNDRQNEVWAFAKISSFLKGSIGFKKKWPTLPLTFAQSILMNELLEAFVARTESGFYEGRNWRRWFNANDRGLRRSMSDEQLLIHKAYLTELIAMRRDKEMPEPVRPMGSIPQHQQPRK